MEIWFYHLQSQRLERALPALLERALGQGSRTVIQATSEERLEAFDDLLWTCAEASFLAHGRARDGDADMQPIYLTCGDENPNGARLRLFVDGADLAANLSAGAAYERAILLFDGNDADQLESARRQWRVLRDKGFALTYWQQNDAGGWEKKR